MRCFFCNDPAAHPATGCEYTPTVLACHGCTVGFWVWFRRHNNGRPRKGSLRTELSFYEAAGLWRGRLPVTLRRLHETFLSRAKQCPGP